MLARLLVALSLLSALAFGYQEAKTDVTGQWTWKMAGPGGQDVEAPAEFKQEGDKITGVFFGGPDRKLPIVKGSINGNEIKLTVKRERPQGGEMIYEMTGTVKGDKIEGNVETEMEGNKMSQPWSATRKK
jgi:hypothetical protein